ncbi:hypothetical protein NBRGN_026_00680 [Nocardia brasiliensis NBRC 14402]|uniref:TetR/AcrR family transcriptional regulator n=1 Tax=Nocardia brasiliensis TaxID=37326 RepID=UPI00045CE4BE|nr:TetR/AcrR family transcriptional regulator [Nocardia brasiliensis]ASF08999.1 TetR/AcrR family transcriptional regulator [Nocardia brasiliensis]GAJ80315.1 hypothetical protein NBRGN_026_00680 [Nocardia brasiliensis NBRC 14402]SUB40391.1 Uncharacterised protein [Nocardia brasiliensis]
MQSRIYITREELAARGVGLALEAGVGQVAVRDLLARFHISREVFHFHFKDMDDLFDFAILSSCDDVADLIERRESLRGPAAIVLIDIWLAVLFGTAAQKLIVFRGDPGSELPSARRNVYGQLIAASHRLLLRAIREGDLRCVADAYSAAELVQRIVLKPAITVQGRSLPSAPALRRAMSITARDIGIAACQPYLTEYLARRLMLVHGERWRVVQLDR